MQKPVIFKAVNKFKLPEDYTVQTTLRPIHIVETQLFTLTTDGVLTIFKGYEWNGCTPHISVLGLFFIGTPDGVTELNTGKPLLYYPSCVHDALTGGHPRLIQVGITQLAVDREFLRLMREKDFGLAVSYYYAVRVRDRFRE